MSKFADLDGSVPTPSRYPHPTGVHSRLMAAKISLLRMGNPAILLKHPVELNTNSEPIETATPDLFEATYAERIRNVNLKYNSYTSFTGGLEYILESDERMIELFCTATFGDYVGDCDVNNPDFSEFSKIGNFMFGVQDGFICLVYVGNEHDAPQEYAAWATSDEALTASCLAWIARQLAAISSR